MGLNYAYCYKIDKRRIHIDDSDDDVGRRRRGSDKRCTCVLLGRAAMAKRAGAMGCSRLHVRLILLVQEED